MYKAFYILLLIPMILLGCAAEPKREQQLVIEGWISEGEPPVVMLHHSITFDEEEDSINDIISSKLIKWATVTIDDGSQQVELLAQMDSKLLPPVKFSTSKMIGKRGKNYKLSVDYKEEHAVSTTSLLQNVFIDSIVAHPLSDGQADVYVYFDDCDDSDINYYVLFYKYLHDSQYMACPMGVCDDSESINGCLRLKAYRRTSSLVSKTFSSIQFGIGDSVSFKLCHVDEPSYRFWMSYSSKMISLNVPITASYNIETNISGGLGYWSGLGGISQFVVIKSGKTVF